MTRKSQRLDLRDAFAIVRAYVDETWPGNHGITILVDLPGNTEPARLPVPACCANGHGDPEADFEQAIIQVIDELAEGETLTGQQVAAKSGYPFNSRMREALARLVRDGRIANRHPGYGPPG